VQRQDVEPVTYEREPLGALDHAIEEIPMHLEQAPAIGCRMESLFSQLDAAEGNLAEMTPESVMIARNVANRRPSSRCPQMSCGKIAT